MKTVLHGWLWYAGLLQFPFDVAFVIWNRPHAFEEEFTCVGTPLLSVIAMQDSASAWEDDRPAAWSVCGLQPLLSGHTGPAAPTAPPVLPVCPAVDPDRSCSCPVVSATGDVPLMMSSRFRYRPKSRSRARTNPLGMRRFGS